MISYRFVVKSMCHMGQTRVLMNLISKGNKCLLVDVYMTNTADIKQQIPLIPVLCRFSYAKAIIEDLFVGSIYKGWRAV